MCLQFDIILHSILIVMLLINGFVLYYVVRKQRKTIEIYEKMFQEKKA